MTTKTPRTRGPSPRAHLGPRTPDVAIIGQTPLAELRIYESTVLFTRRSGASWRQYLVNPDQIAQLLGKLPVASGLLPPHTLGNGTIQGAPFYLVYVPPRVATLQSNP